MISRLGSSRKEREKMNAIRASHAEGRMGALTDDDRHLLARFIDKNRSGGKALLKFAMQATKDFLRGRDLGMHQGANLYDVLDANWRDETSRLRAQAVEAERKKLRVHEQEELEEELEKRLREAVSPSKRTRLFVFAEQIRREIPELRGGPDPISIAELFDLKQREFRDRSMRGLES